MTVRYSRQREAILDYVKSVTCHPTADEVFSNVREVIPNISLGTVYRNLSQLVLQGDIDIIKTPDGADRFDGNTKPHDHIVCRDCGKLDDIFELAHQESVNEEAGKMSGYKQVRHSILFSGICTDCTDKN